jgi:hypothetical protein
MDTFEYIKAKNLFPLKDIIKKKTNYTLGNSSNS